MWHCDDLPCSEEEEDEKHVKVEACIERRRKDVIIPCPNFVMMSIRPIHDHEPPDDGRDVARTDVAVEVGHRGEEDGAVKEVELCSWEVSVKGVDDKRGSDTQEEAVRNWAVEGFRKESFGALIIHQPGKSCKKDLNLPPTHIERQGITQ